jgi:hypothetical protein
MDRAAVPAPRTWVSFLASPASVPTPFVGVVVDGGITRYRVEKVVNVAGDPLAVAAGWSVARIESRAKIPAVATDLALTGVTQHPGYTGASDRQSLERVSRRDPGTVAVLIPIRKTEAWWAMAQDERLAFFHRRNGSAGHIAIGQRFAGKILRRLYHARYQPDGQWDFLTYFELSPNQATTFRTLLASMRNPRRNPEWRFVEREVEIWMKKL